MTALAAIAADLSRIDGLPVPDALVGMGGAITNITAVAHGLVDYDPDIVQGSVLEGTEVDRQIELYRSCDTETRRAIVGLQPKRADVILAGACIVRTVMDKLDQDRPDRERSWPPPRGAGRALRRPADRDTRENAHDEACTGGALCLLGWSLDRGHGLFE